MSHEFPSAVDVSQNSPNVQIRCLKCPPPFRVYTFMQCICYKKIKENGEARLVKQCLYYYLHGIASCSHRAVRELTIVIENEKKMNLHI